MTLDEFIKEWNGRFNNFDGVYDNQCVDLVKQYIKDVLEFEPFAANAIDYPQKYSRDNFTFHNNPLWYVPPRGAIAIWNWKYGNGKGHVGIVTAASLMSFVSFDQNWPVGSPSVLVNHKYTDVVGFLLPRRNDITELYNNLVNDIHLLSNRYTIIAG